MNDFQPGDIVKAHILETPDDRLYVVTKIDHEGKNGRPVADLVADDEPSDIRWQYMEKLTLVARIANTANLREYREKLGLSRREVQEGAGVSGSALWRIEQVMDGGTYAQRAAVWQFLVNFETKNPDGKPKSSRLPAKKDDKLVRIEAERDTWINHAKYLESVVALAVTELDQQIVKATTNKTSTKGLKSIKAILEGQAAE